jgi:anti-anti-sigma factor
MKRHHPASDTTAGAGHERDALEGVARQVLTAAGENTTEQRVELSPRAAGRITRAAERPPVSPTETHRLVLVGRLDSASTYRLEAEIERLCEAGISAITLDLSELSGIDGAGVAVIAFRAKWCRRHGCELVLIPGSSAVQRAFELAGARDDLPFKEASRTSNT